MVTIRSRSHSRRVPGPDWRTWNGCRNLKDVTKDPVEAGMKFKLNTKVLSGDSSGENIKIEVEAAKGGKQETVAKPSNTNLSP
jgi:hypothetical protein